MVATGVDAAVLSPDIQRMIEGAMLDHHIEHGIGYFAGEDVRAYLQEQALRASRRFDPARGAKITTFLHWRIHGAAKQLVRSKGTRTRAGNVRVRAQSLDQELDVLAKPDASQNRALRTEEDGLQESEEMADMVLAISRLPVRLRLVLYLHFYEELDLQACAARLCCSPESAQGLRDAAVMKLRLAMVRRA